MTMKIGEIAALAGVPTATVRYYERRRLIAAPPRSSAGYRQYGPETARRLRFIKRAQALGFTLEEIRELVDLRVEEPASCAAVEERTREKIAAVRRKIAELERLEVVLSGVANSCAARMPTAECPVLEMLIDEEALDT